MRAPERTTPDRGQTQRGGEPEAGAATARISKGEWATAALGAALVLGAIGVLLFEALARPTTPPDVVVRAERVVPVRAGFLVEFVAENRGSETAAELTVRGELRARGDSAGAPPLETRETQLDYLPGRSERKGGLFYTRDPRAHALTLKAAGYREP